MPLDDASEPASEPPASSGTATDNGIYRTLPRHPEKRHRTSQGLVLARCGRARRRIRTIPMPERPPPPTPERRPAWRAAALAYRQARRDGASHDAAMDAAERGLRSNGRSYPRRRPPPRSLPRSPTQPATTRHGFGTVLAPSSPLERGCSTTFGHPHSAMATPRVGLPGCQGDRGQGSTRRRRAAFRSRDAAFLKPDAGRVRRKG